MSTSPLPKQWPARPEGFYSDWEVFCRELISFKLQAVPASGGNDELAVLLLAGGAVLGANGLLWLVRQNRDVIDQKGVEWGIEELSTIALAGGAVLGAVVGSAGAALLLRVLSRVADPKKVNKVQEIFAGIRRRFEEINQDHAAGRIDDVHRRLKLEELYHSTRT